MARTRGKSRLSEPVACAFYLRQEIRWSICRKSTALDDGGNRGTRGEILRQHVVYGRVVAVRIADVDDAADGVVGVAFAFAPDDGVTARENEGLALDLHLQDAAARRVADRELHEETLVSHEPAAEPFREV